MKNYRSTKHIVDLINKSIKNMNLPDLEASFKGEKDIRCLNFDSEDAESEFVIQRILASDTAKEEIFVLARTNRQLDEISNLMKLRKIKHIVRKEEFNKEIEERKDHVTLSTIHAIKGMEAKMVFVIGCTSFNFPCKGSEHPVMEIVDLAEYDKEEEERRLFYVAMSRAKESLYISYSGKSMTYFINDDMKKIIGNKADTKKIMDKPVNISSKANTSSSDLFTRLKEWRKELSVKQNIPAFIIMHDKTLIEIAQAMPLSEEELENINGIGPAKIMKYGSDILDVVNGKM